MPVAIDQHAGQDPHPIESSPYPSQAEPFNIGDSWDANYIDAMSLPMSSNTWTHPMASMDSIPYHDTSGSPTVDNPYRPNDTGIISPQTDEPTAGLAPSAPTTSATTATRNSTSATSRQRTFQACDKCRDRKTKCSGAKPVCERCVARGLICHYTVSKASSSRKRSISYSSVEGAGLQQYSRPKAVDRLSFPYGSSPHALKASIPSTTAAGALPVNSDSHQLEAFHATAFDTFRPPSASLYRPQSSAMESSSAASLNVTSPGLFYRDAADVTSRPTLRPSRSHSGSSEPAPAPGREVWPASPSLVHRPPAEHDMLALLTDDLTPRGGGEHGGYAGYGIPTSAPHPEFVSPSPFYEETSGARDCSP
ncbi:hypothetical protein EWM64_g7633 [Hericium alpestre]|uniref:Zn(2)-C6 fungal-type domain-containing protein n=1 Tax=Hericium alpestre TaxID=135208 RepID=A0A4Y9ZNL6_9AGAM|nr:hypothetical protein EWM64_g7633 [Hericium alpestre]